MEMNFERHQMIHRRTRRCGFPAARFPLFVRDAGVCISFKSYQSDKKQQTIPLKQVQSGEKQRAADKTLLFSCSLYLCQANLSSCWLQLHI